MALPLVDIKERMRTGFMDKQTYKIAVVGKSGRHPSFRLIGFSNLFLVTEPQESDQ